MNKLIYIFLSVLVLFSTACRRHKLKKSIIEISTQGEKKEDSKLPEIEKKADKFTFNVPNVNFETCKIKSKVTFNSPKLRQTIPVTIHVKKDSIIWISVSLMLEVARINITPDTIQILDKLNRKYYSTSFKSLSKMFEFDVDFQILQSALLGNLPIKPNLNDLYFEEAKNFRLSQKRKNVTFENKFDKDNMKLFLVEAKDSVSKAQMELSFKNYVKESDFFVPNLIQLLFIGGQNGEKTNIDFEHSKFDFLDRNLRFPFNVPKGYEIMEMPGLNK
jgi:Domain of unknown function (DUF4292)